MINKDTKLYGSFSSNPGNNGCIFFNNAFEKYNINAIYKSFYSTDANELVRSVKHLNFSGFAISMPLKVEIIKYLDEIDEAALEIGAVNTVINNNGYLIGYNTDWIGFSNFFLKYYSFLPINNISILGNGGFSKAIQYACKKLNLKYEVITRNEWQKISEITNLIVNATPVEVIHNNLIDGRPFTEDGKKIAIFQAIEQFYLYTGLNYE